MSEKSISELCDQALKILNETKAILTKKDAKIELAAQSMARRSTGDATREVNQVADS